MRKSMDPVQKWLVPTVYPDTPTFLGVPRAVGPEDLAGADVAIVGVPFETAPGVTRTYAYSLLTPVELRKRSLKYGGYLPELDLDVFDYLRVVDYGDAPICVRGDVEASVAATQGKLRDVLAAGCVPLVFGGTEIVASYALAKSLAECGPGPLGLITLDAHGDNMEEHQGSRWLGACWIARMSELPGVDMGRHVHIGMRGPRNFKEQVTWFRERGTLLITPREIRRLGMEKVIDQTLARACRGSGRVFMSIDFDVLDMGCAPGLDEPLGLSVENLLDLCFQVARHRLDGLAVGWVPQPDERLHWVVTWVLVYVLAGLAVGRKGAPYRS